MLKTLSLPRVRTHAEQLLTADPYSAVYCDDGLNTGSQKRYQQRRHTLAETITGLMVINGEPHPASERANWDMIDVPFYQNPAFQYLTGISQPGCALVIDSRVSPPQEMLFVPPKDEGREFWNGVQLGTGSPASEQTARDVTGIQAVRDIRTLFAVLTEKTAACDTLYSYWHQPDYQDSHAQFKQQLHQVLPPTRPGLTLQNLGPVLDYQSVVFDDVDKANERIANRLTTAAYVNTFQAVKHYTNEMEVSGHLLGELRKRTPKGLSFANIVAAGGNAATLHYMKNDMRLNKDAMILIDGGARWQSMNADVTRTIPISGTYTPMQRILYQIVLDTQKTVENAARAGVTIDELNDLCWSTLDRLLEERFIRQGGTVQRPYDKKPCNVSHLLGHHTHDGPAGTVPTGRIYNATPMVPGWIISNEPGLYGHFEITLNGQHYAEDLGIRIEDDLYITKTGCENLTDCPKEITAIEQLMTKPEKAGVRDGKAE